MLSLTIFGAKSSLIIRSPSAKEGLHPDITYSLMIYI